MMMRGSETSQILSEYIDQAMVGKISARDALDSAVKDINELLQ